MTIEPRAANLNYSLRRYFIDAYQARVVGAWAAGSRVLDLGGDKIQKRGQFDIAQCPLHTTYANASIAKRPDVQADAAVLPFRDAAFDGVVCAELLEHVYDPRRVIQEVRRVLKPGGRLVITAPFMVHIHADPDDYGRYTDTFWTRLLEETGFDQVAIERQGRFWSVILDALRARLLEIRRHHPSRRLFAGMLGPILVWGRRRAMLSEGVPPPGASPASSSFTTGFGISSRKRPESAT
jgi:SAM-dependent methyltransferase